MHNYAANIVRQSLAVKQSFLESGVDQCVAAARLIANAFVSGNKLLIFGNGGSAADAQHMAAEFINRFLMERPELPAIALTANGCSLTAIGNDYDFVEIFSKQVKGLGQENDVALGITTSGRSANVLRALADARTRGLKTIALVGSNTAEIAPLCDMVISAPSSHTPRIQEVHSLAIHMICEMVDIILFGNNAQEG